ncbi:HNH endonuclease [Halorussus sp. MSC15.2]|uniref:HNH endonuclease n=1 Tax=Halorussus sp. MSC15.2 TaxID=2283638 RepID=UPI0013D49B24|nr:HNH endonuclease [Halorussus sp. MSC15.2]NEU55527.1 HNH endonuclease [Halorussus sp. MSC15.2]
MPASDYPSDWGRRRKRVYERDNYTCQNCGARGGPHGSAELHAHHGVPLSKGGSNRMSNLTTYCKRCHEAIHGSDKTAPTGDGAGNGREGTPEVTWTDLKESWNGGAWYEKMTVATLLGGAVAIAVPVIGLASSIPAAVVLLFLGGSPGTSDLYPIWLPIWFGLTALAFRNFLQT